MTEEDLYWWLHHQLGDAEARRKSANAVAADEWEAATQIYLAVVVQDNGALISAELKQKVLDFYDEEGDNRDSLLAVLSG